MFKQIQTQFYIYFILALISKMCSFNLIRNFIAYDSFFCESLSIRKRVGIYHANFSSVFEGLL